ncbi:3-hydroxyacyl-CoA dehydrogenase NAD-binding domain-containing protein [Novosphingobium sp. ST904]|uniref:3-hydroxyacyl-CoA dehydrogenase NAD-binding domain-containing protein n=1 Tax=Novosphingobium sp. ST904 TaxID=1684385 RepID=UPI00104A8CAD|nr:3-hydroxyacyl-CoA dehydrogenase NAD-binding domain-containing protein [Novosphingobium sp. ST904]TCM41275.1 3-hydroxyacyl-CoA dehydrogenase [Novosphingobium sp. ST904]
MIRTALSGTILEITLDNPPVNALGASVRAGLSEAVARAASDDAVTAIILTGAGKLFSAGADISEFGKPLADPQLPDVLDAIETCPKPVIAAINGTALGGGLELALACHYRIALEEAKLGLPEVTLGILPGAGGTQRLPRFVGLDEALRMIVSGSPIAAAKAAGIGLVDHMVADYAELLPAARELAASGLPARPTRLREVSGEAGSADAFVAANPRLFKGLHAPAACVEAVKAAAALPFAEGMAVERRLFLDLVAGDQSRALRQAFFAERSAGRIEDLPKDTPLREIGRVGIIGAGTMGGGIAMNFLSAGIPVTMVETNGEALERGTGVIRRNYEASAAKGRLTPEQVETAMDRLSPTLDFEALAQCDLVIEAVYENMDVKKEVFARLDKVARPGAILASNTSYLDVDEIAASTSRPQDVVGLHFFSPANVMKLVEVVRGAKTAPDVIATAMALGRRIGKVPVVAGVCYGFIGNRMLIPRQDNALALILEGASPDQVDRVHTDFGMPMGPFQMTDLAGVDIGWHRDPARIENLKDALCAQGRWGQKTGVGFYDYDEQRKRTNSPVVTALIEEFREREGIVPREIADEEIVVRTLYTMVNEGAKILEERIAQRASDIDVVWLHGYGWPRWTGGPMFWAGETGLARIVEALNRHADRLPADFTVSPLLRDLARRGEGFA